VLDFCRRLVAFLPDDAHSDAQVICNERWRRLIVRVTLRGGRVERRIQVAFQDRVE
jgi:hypothetical protein